MLKRIITGVIGAALMLAVLLLGGAVGVAVAMAVLSVVAVYELLNASGFAWRYRVPAIVGGAAAPLVLLVNLWAPVALAVAYLLLVMLWCVMRHEEMSPERAGLLWLLPTYAAGGFTAMTALRLTGDNGLLYVFLAMIIPWLSDTGAYFTGVCFGRHKLCPVISPKKTIEGLVGGIVTSVLAAVLTGWLYALLCGHPVTLLWAQIALVTAVSAPLSVIGDLFASVVKRRFSVKDYGNIMPGHGGIMDRFDSVLPVALLLLIAVQMLPLAA